MGDVPLIGVAKWQIRLICFEDDAKLNYAELVYEPTLRPVLGRARTLIGRASYMGDIGQRNREICWTIDRWIKENEKWVSVMEGKSKLRVGQLPQ